MPKMPREREIFSLLPGFWIYMALVFPARVFTQALRSPVSSVLYIFLLILPFAMLIYILVCALSVKVKPGRAIPEVMKNTPFDFGFGIANRSFLPISYAEADLLFPDESGVKCSERRVRISILPFSACEFGDKLAFPYRGEYRIGVRAVYVYDLFRLFRFKLITDVYTDICVLPRLITLGNADMRAFADVNTDSSVGKNGVDRAEISDIKVYVNGDSMKNVHWKLSSKTQDLMVKQYRMNSGCTARIYCDFSRGYAADAETSYASESALPADINEYAADLVAETALAIAAGITGDGGECELIWYDKRASNGVERRRAERGREIKPLLRSIATAPIYDKGPRMSELARKDSPEKGTTMVFVTGLLDSALTDELCALAALSGKKSEGGITVYYVSPAGHAAPSVRKKLLDEARSCRLRLNSFSVDVIEPVIGT